LKKEAFMNRMFYARSVEKDPDKTHWQLLEDHLFQVAEIASRFAEKFSSKDWGYIAGLWHDLGKYQEEFQKKLIDETIRVEHSGVGAYLSFEKNKSMYLPLAFIIAGHHAGLTNCKFSETGMPSDLQKRIKNNKQKIGNCRTNIPLEITQKEFPQIPDFIVSKLNIDFWIRFLFSALVDADRINSAEFTDPSLKTLREGYDSINELGKNCDQYIDKIMKNLTADKKNKTVNILRKSILGQCREKAVSSPDVFSLTVPTGGGKTLSSMSFALNHAEKNNLQRVIVVIPYTSIIEQNAKVYKEALGIKNVLEHHSNLDPQKQKEIKGDELAKKHELATENWDAPVIVTTSVQFFETLFSNKPSKCRKLHNIAKSVIILDEIQTIPPKYLNCILDALNQLVKNYGCSVVLSTATPPALGLRKSLKYGFKNVLPIIENPGEIAEKLKRVDIIWPEQKEDVWDIEDLANELDDLVEDQFLCIVHKRSDARELAKAIENRGCENVFHLSALMCPKHRLDTIESIDNVLKEKKPCRVVSTQLVEAGVDLDFPVVYRALAGLDSIVQAAGRCNREGNLESGKVVVFRSKSKPPPGTPTTALYVMEGLLLDDEKNLDVSDPEIFERYFRELYFSRATDQKNIQGNRKEFNFATVGRDFKMIEDGFTYTIIVPWGDSEERLSKLRNAINGGHPKKEHLRSLQPFTVNVYEKSFYKLQNAGAIDEVMEGLFALNGTHNYLYDRKYGLVIGDNPIVADPEYTTI